MPHLLRWLLLVFVAAVFFLLPAFAGVYTDWLWFGEIGYRQVFVTEITTRGWLLAGALAVRLRGAGREPADGARHAAALAGPVGRTSPARR